MENLSRTVTLIAPVAQPIDRPSPQSYIAFERSSLRPVLVVGTSSNTHTMILAACPSHPESMHVRSLQCFEPQSKRYVEAPVNRALSAKLYENEDDAACYQRIVILSLSSRISIDRDPSIETYYNAYVAHRHWDIDVQKG